MEGIEESWRKASYSGNGGNCVVVGHVGGAVAVKDAKQSDRGPVLAFTPEAWRRFTAAVRQSLGA